MASPASRSPAPAPQPEDEPFDLLLPLRSTGNRENPYPIYALIRTVRPVLELPTPDYDGPGAWLLTRYEDVHTALRDPRFSVERTRAPLIRDNLERMPEFLRQSARGLRSRLSRMSGARVRSTEKRGSRSAVCTSS